MFEQRLLFAENSFLFSLYVTVVVRFPDGRYRSASNTVRIALNSPVTRRARRPFQTIGCATGGANDSIHQTDDNTYSFVVRLRGTPLSCRATGTPERPITAAAYNAFAVRFREEGG